MNFSFNSGNVCTCTYIYIHVQFSANLNGAKLFLKRVYFRQKLKNFELQGKRSIFFYFTAYKIEIHVEIQVINERIFKFRHVNYTLKMIALFKKYIELYFNILKVSYKDKFHALWILNTINIISN